MSLSEDTDDKSPSLREQVAQFRQGLKPAGALPMLLLMGLAATQGFDQTAFGILSPEIRHAFHLDNAGINGVTALTAAVPLLFAVFLGYLGDKGNRLRITRFAGIIWGVTAIGTGLAPVLLILVVARLAGGIGLLSSQTIYPSLLSDYYRPENLPKVITVFLLGSTGFGLISSPLSGWLGSAFGWRSAFVILALPTFVFVILLRFIHEPARGAHAPLELDPAAAAGPSTLRQLGHSFRELRTVGTLRRTWVGAFFVGAGAISISTITNTFFHDVYHLGSTARGGIGALVGVAGLGGIIIGGGAAQRFASQGRSGLLPVVTGGCVFVAGFFVLVLGAVPVLWGSIAAAFFVALGATGFLPGYFSTIAAVTPTRLRSQAYAWSLLFFVLGALIISVTIGVIADSAGERVALGVLSVLVMLGGAIVASARHHMATDIANNETPPLPIP